MSSQDAARPGSKKGGPQGGGGTARRGAGAGDSNSWSPGDAYLWARKHETSNANPPPRPGRGDGLLGDMPQPHPPRPHHEHAPLPSQAPTGVAPQQYTLRAPARASSSGALVAGRRSWTAWVDYRSKVVSNEDMTLEGAQRADVTSVQDFARLWSDLEASGEGVVDGCNVAVFTKGVRPTWEASQAHGKWVLLTDKHETYAKLALVLQAVMERQHPNLAHVCGVVLSVRPTRDCIAVWNTRGGDSHFIKATRNALVHAAKLPPAQKLNYFIIRTGPSPGQGGAAPRGDSLSLPASLPSSQTEGGGLRRTRPAVGIDTDVEGLERLRRAMSRAPSERPPMWGGNAGEVGGGLQLYEVRAEEREWSPYGVHGVEADADAAWRQGGDTVTWPPPAAAGHGGLGGLGVGRGGYNAFSGPSIWGGPASSPGLTASLQHEVDVSPGVARHIEAILASSPSTEGDSPPPAHDAAHSLSTAVVAGTSGSSWGPSPAVGKNPPFFTGSPGLEGREEQGGDADESEGEDGGEEEGGEVEVEEGGAEQEGERVNGRAAASEGVLVGDWRVEEEDEEEDVVDAAMDGGAFGGGGAEGGRCLSRDLRVKLAMRSVIAAEKLAEKGVIVGKKGRRKDKRSDQSSTESDVVHSSRVPSVYSSSAQHKAHGGGDVTCAQRTMWALCGAGLTAGSALLFAYLSSDSGVPLMII